MADEDEYSESDYIQPPKAAAGSPPAKKARVQQNWKDWVFTLNNPQMSAHDLRELLDLHCERAVFQLEKGEAGTMHFQGTLEMGARKQLSGMKKILPTAHWEKRRGTWQQSKDYCEKEDTRVDGPWYVKTEKTRKHELRIKPEERRPWQKKLWDIVNGEPDKRKIIWVWEDKGNSGKTSITHDIIVDMMKQNKLALCVSGKAADIKAAIAASMAPKKGEGKEPTAVIWDVPRTRENYMDYAALEEIKNAMFFSGKYESGMVMCTTTPHVIVMANFPPDKTKLSEDRWDVWDINAEHFVPGGSVPKPPEEEWEDAIE